MASTLRFLSWTLETRSLSTISSRTGLGMGSEYARNQAVRTGALPIGCLHRGSGSNARDGASENVAQKVRSDVDARDGQQHRGDKEGQSLASQAMHEEDGRDGDACHRVIGGERKVGTSFYEQMANANVVGAEPLDKQQDDLVEPEAKLERQACRDEDVAPGAVPARKPPLHRHGQDENRNAQCRHPGHEDVGGGKVSCPPVDPGGQGGIKIDDPELRQDWSEEG